MELQKRRSSGVAKGGLTTGIIGTALGGLNSLALMGAGVNAAARNNDTVDVVTPVAPVNPWGWGAGFGGNWGNWGGFWGGNPWFGQMPQTVVVNTNEDRVRDGRNGEGCCSEDHLVNRYELGQEKEIAKLQSEIALRDANTFTDQKNLEMYKYVDGRLKDVERELAAQAVVNQKTADSFVLAQKDLQCCCDKLQLQIDRERDERKCSDNTIITYTNATFYPKMVADVTTGTTTTAQSTYNPLPCSSGCNCNR